MLSTLSPERRQIVSQLLRFLVSGAVVTVLGVGTYALVALVLRWHPQIGNLLGYLVAMATGYWMHSRWSFRDHGQRSQATVVKFVIVSLVSLGLNSLWVFLITGPLGLGPAWPIVPMLLITPMVTFVLNRQWVFG
jgi:putative flippase GtrA